MATSIHFPGASEPDGKRKVLRLRFDSEPKAITESIMKLSSSELRSLLGMSYSELHHAAESSRRSLNSHALQIIGSSLSNNSAQRELIDGVLGTYKGGKGDFFHDLFPYLEAFSPDFVRSIVDRIGTDPKILLDPFGGCGTAPLTFTYDEPLKRKAYYCELNPLMQRIVGVKERLRSVSIEKRLEVRSRVLSFCEGLANSESMASPDDLLKASYHETFGESDMFPERTYQQVLRTKSIINQLRSNDPLLASIVEIATLASLVPASNMQRAGDLRRKRENERLRISSNLFEHIEGNLLAIAGKLDSFETASPKCYLISDDARNLSRIPNLGADILITSPPYLNGTNYFRNTKLELWFLGVLSSSEDLGRLRDLAITAGINDVRGIRGVSEPESPIPSCFGECLEELQETSYDRRIPQMVRWYAHDLEQSLTSALAHVRRNAPIAIDIGDSIYADVRVPTDVLVTELLERNGCLVDEILPIRNRMARKGRVVHQVCVIARKGKPETQNRLSQRRPRMTKWKQFQSSMPHQYPPYNKRNWGHPWHSMCSFQGKLKPAISHFITQALLPKSGTLLDPFVGVGTIPFEAACAGHKTYGFDMSPAAVAIARAKTAEPDTAAIEQKLQLLGDYVESHANKQHRTEWLPNFNRPLDEYYHPQTLTEILAARRWFLEQRPWCQTNSLLLACMMHILHGNRPYALSRRSHPVTPYAPTGETIYKPIIPKLLEKVERVLSHELPRKFCPGTIYQHDATERWPLEVQDLDAVVTSPPFFDSTRFFLANWIRLWFAGWDKNDFKSGQAQFLEERQKQSMDCYLPIFRQTKERLKEGGVMLLHLGRSKKCDMGEELQNVAKRWFRHIELVNESVLHCESHGIRDKGTVTEHQYLLLY